ncbi:hypothetical protein SAMN05421781_1890 [Marinococcus luteus]|uniref:Uncharacterized protein n=1 Tax=Marinococcus luteus TaxID=1122204 RepID=A0A1H2UTK2_9BACI|nr:hypothetical protein [Marinococcus luteus]SDW59395.1 hypothetical protein SAMN05421781_1890 [Marinococcus luteus]
MMNLSFFSLINEGLSAVFAVDLTQEYVFFLFSFAFFLLFRPLCFLWMPPLQHLLRCSWYVIIAVAFFQEWAGALIILFFALAAECWHLLFAALEANNRKSPS